MQLNRILKNIETTEHESMKKEYYRKQENERKEAIKRSIKQELYLSALPKPYNTFNLVELVPSTIYQKKLIDLLLSWDMNLNFKLPYVYGSPGTGKSFIAMNFVHHLIVNGMKAVRFISVSEFLIKYRDYGFKENINDLLDPAVLVLDDLCSHNITRHVLELLHSTLDHRLVNKKPTLITSNISIDKVSKALFKAGRNYDVSKVMCDAVEDRLFELCSISKVDGESLRLKNALKTLRV